MTLVPNAKSPSDGGDEGAWGPKPKPVCDEGKWALKPKDDAGGWAPKPEDDEGG